jgi:hypothetical protein
MRSYRVTTTQSKIQLVDVFGKGARGRIQQGTAADRIVTIYTFSPVLTRSAINLFLYSPLRGRYRKQQVASPAQARLPKNWRSDRTPEGGRGPVNRAER